MCLRIKVTEKEYISNRVSPKIAKEDIIVYKALVLVKEGKKLFSPYQWFQYEKGTHYYQTGKQKFTIYFSNSWLFGYIAEVVQGLHSCKSKYRAELYADERSVIVKMIVPKGARYYENESEIVSDQLIFPY